MITAVSTGAMLCLGRVYALTMLYNLNYRSSLNQRSTDINTTYDIETNQTMKITNGIRKCLPGIIRTRNLMQKPDHDLLL